MRLPVILLLLLGTACGDVSEETRPPNVLVISIDMLRADHVGSYGYARNTTPALDQLAREGVRFEEHISSAPWTLPAHASLFSSLPGSLHGATDAGGVALAEDHVTLAEEFARAGYRTAGFYAGPYLHAAFGLGQGFERYRYCVDYAAEFDAAQVNEWGPDPEAQRRSHHGMTNPAVHGQAREWLEGLGGDSPFFLFVHLWDTHYDFVPPAEYASMFTDPEYDGWVTGREFFFDKRIHAGMAAQDLAQLVALYDAEIRWTDAFVHKLVADLERLGVMDDTLILVTSDHGTELFDHGQKGHRRTLYDEALHVPLVLRGPGVPAGARVPAQTRTVDLAPTLLDLCGLRPPATWTGRSLVRLMHGSEDELGEPALSELLSDGQQLRSLRRPGGKVVRDATSDAAAWFDLATDPFERASAVVAEGGPGAAGLAQLIELERALAARRASGPPPGVAGTVPAGVHGALQANGYAGGDED